VANTERIQVLETTSATLVERVNNLRDDLERHEETFPGLSNQVQDNDRKLAVIEHRVGALEKKLDELLARRWELWKLVLAAFLGSMLTLGTSFVARWLDRFLQPSSNQSNSAPSLPVPRK